MKKTIVILSVILLSSSAFASNIIGNLHNDPESVSKSSVRDSGNSHNKLNSRQNQLQGQGQTQSNKSKNSNRNTNEGNDNAISIDGDTYVEKRNPVNTAYAPMLTSGVDTCLGSVSAGGQAATFGVSVGKTILDKDCVTRKDARLLYNMGFAHAAIHLLCQKPDILKAMGDAGEKECSNMRKKRVTMVFNTSNKRKCQFPGERNCI